MYAVTYGSTRASMMARHRANHVQVVYVRDAAAADMAALTKAALARALGINVCFYSTPGEGGSTQPSLVAPGAKRTSQLGQLAP